MAFSQLRICRPPPSLKSGEIFLGTFQNILRRKKKCNKEKKIEKRYHETQLPRLALSRNRSSMNIEQLCSDDHSHEIEASRTAFDLLITLMHFHEMVAMIYPQRFLWHARAESDAQPDT